LFHFSNTNRLLKTFRAGDVGSLSPRARRVGA
jgi:hypothetical protein